MTGPRKEKRSNTLRCSSASFDRPQVRGSHPFGLPSLDDLYNPALACKAIMGFVNSLYNKRCGVANVDFVVPAETNGLQNQ